MAVLFAEPLFSLDQPLFFSCGAVFFQTGFALKTLRPSALRDIFLRSRPCSFLLWHLVNVSFFLPGEKTLRVFSCHDELSLITSWRALAVAGGRAGQSHALPLSSPEYQCGARDTIPSAILKANIFLFPLILSDSRLSLNHGRSITDGQENVTFIRKLIVFSCCLRSKRNILC